jgi:hypothetical protein
MSARKPKPARATQIILSDTARETRSTLRRIRLPVDPQLHELVSKRRGVATARQLTLLADEMIAAFGESGAVEHFAQMGARLVSARMAG